MGIKLKTIILAGGLGTRLSEETISKPKPMVEVGGIPIIQHILNVYHTQGFSEFILALGYKKELLENWASGFLAPSDPRITTLDTGLETQTGGRVKRAIQSREDKIYFVTYGDGLANIDLSKLLKFHLSHGKIATVTAVRPPARFGHLQIEGSQVTHFGEKNQADEGWINGGFFVFNREIVNSIHSDSEALENGALPRLAQQNQLMAYHHFGFWKPMDALRDKIELDELAKLNPQPWLNY
jgi:glucose-1-phosphate cytidylyltransferase